MRRNVIGVLFWVALYILAPPFFGYGAYAQTVTEIAYPDPADSTTYVTLTIITYPDTVTFLDTVMESWSYTELGINQWVTTITRIEKTGAIPTLGVVVVTKEPEPIWDKYDLNRDGSIDLLDYIHARFRYLYGIEL